MSAAATHRSRRTPYPHYGMQSVVIELNLADSHRPLQRHIWRRTDGTEYAEEWTRSPIHWGPERLVRSHFDSL